MTAESKALKMLAESGELLFGPRWKLAMSKALGITNETMHEWVSGRTQIKPDHPIFDKLAAVLREHAEAASKRSHKMQVLARRVGRMPKPEKIQRNLAGEGWRAPVEGGN